MSNRQIVIDTRHCDQSPGLNARKIWQQLFNIYRYCGGDLNDLDWLICDLYTITKFFQDWKRFDEKTRPDFYWSFNYGSTNITCFRAVDAWHVHLTDDYTIVLDFIPLPEDIDVR